MKRRTPEEEREYKRAYRARKATGPAESQPVIDEPEPEVIKEIPKSPRGRMVPIQGEMTIQQMPQSARDAILRRMVTPSRERG